ncbi:hypothetical protein cypCar_00027574, partial [Cyprinus carpio]
LIPSKIKFHIGDRLPESSLPQQTHRLHRLGLSSYECDSILPLNDLAFDMYQDPEVAHFIHLLDQKKQDMVREERFYLAKNLKQAIADLKKVGEHLGLYDVEKHSAIEREDHDTAKQKKEQLEAYRLTVYQQLELHDLLDISQVILFITFEITCGLEHSDASVQERSVGVVQAMYGLHGKAVLNYLPPDDTSTRKNVLYKNLFDSLAKLNGNTINTREKGKENPKVPEKKAEKATKSGKTVSTAIAKTTTVISESKTRGLGRGSRIPAPAFRINRRTRIPPGKASTKRIQQA